MILFRTVFVRGKTRIGWRASYEITMAGVAATRLFAAAGAGGVALTAWALRRSGMERRVVACRMVAFLALLYVVYMGAIVVFGLGLYVGLFNGPAPFAITVVPGDLRPHRHRDLPGHDAAARRRRAAHHTVGRGSGRGARIMAKVVTIPASAAAGVRTAIALVRDREWGVLGAVAWWAFDIATLWACFHAFGPDPPPFAVIVLAYFVGMLGNALPLPGGIGGVDGGMIGAFAALGVSRTTRSAPCSPIARSPSGCRPCRERSPTSSCAGASPPGARSTARPARPWRRRNDRPPASYYTK